MTMLVKLKTTGEPIIDVEVQCENSIDWDFSKFNPGKVKNSQNIREFDKWLSWIKNTFDMTRPFNYLEIGSYAGESLYYLSQVFPRGSVITLIDLGDNTVAREILLRVCKLIQIEYGHTINLLSGYSNNENIIRQAMAYPKGQALYDMVFIDANHDFGWAYEDFMHYKDKASWVAFHDISDFNIVKTTMKYGKEVANAAHLWKAITTVINQKQHPYAAPPEDKNLNWDQFIDYDNNTDVGIMDLKPRGIGVLYSGAINQ